MKCCRCKRSIAAGVEAAKVIVEYAQDDATTKVFGFQAPDGPLSQATGRIRRAWHHKCYHIDRKAARGAGGVPTGYQITEAMRAGEDLSLRERVSELHALAARLGKALGDPMVTEAWRREQCGASYPHTHDLRLEPYHLLAHLRYAHDVWVSDGDLYELHAQAHVRAASLAVRAARDQDPDYSPPAVTDWRQQVSAEVSDLLPGGTTP